MERAWEEGDETHLPNRRIRLFPPLEKLRSCESKNPFSVLGFWVCFKARFSNGFCLLGKVQYNGMVVNNSVFEEGGAAMECSIEKSVVIEEKSEGLGDNGGEIGTFENLNSEKGRESSSSSDFLISETTGHEEQSQSSSEESSPSSTLGWPIQKVEAPDCSSNGGLEAGEKIHLEGRKLEKQGSALSEIEMMKERFAKLLLGEDMSGCGNGVCTALAISNAITNLCATLFGQLWRLEPLPLKKKLMWRREIEWLLCVSDHIVELIPTWQTFPDGSKLEVMTCRPRLDLYVNLPALRKLDNMLLEILDGFNNTEEFWYVDQGIMATEADGSSSFRRALQRQEEKWWLPVPRVPPGGLHEDTRKHLQYKRDCTNQILKAAMAINSNTLADMEVPESYLESLPKNGKASLGDIIYRYISSEQFNPECLLDCLDLSSEHQAIEIANRVEASIFVWQRRVNSRTSSNTFRSSSRSSWEMVKDLMMDAEKRELLAERAESLLLCLKQRFPGLPQTALDMSKIQYNKDVGKSILESYSRVLESLAFNIVARIDDLLSVDDLTKHSDRFPSIPKVGMIAHKGSYSMPVPNTPYKTAFSTPSFSPARLISPARGERSPFISSGKIPQRGFGAKKVLTDYLTIDTKGNNYVAATEKPELKPNSVDAKLFSQKGTESLDSRKTTASPSTQDLGSEE